MVLLHMTEPERPFTQEYFRHNCKFDVAKAYKSVHYHKSSCNYLPLNLHQREALLSAEKYMQIMIRSWVIAFEIKFSKFSQLANEGQPPFGKKNKAQEME